MELTNLGSEASIYALLYTIFAINYKKIQQNTLQYNKCVIVEKVVWRSLNKT